MSRNGKENPSAIFTQTIVSLLPGFIGGDKPNSFSQALKRIYSIDSCYTDPRRIDHFELDATLFGTSPDKISCVITHLETNNLYAAFRFYKGKAQLGIVYEKKSGEKTNQGLNLQSLTTGIILERSKEDVSILKYDPRNTNGAWVFIDKRLERPQIVTSLDQLLELQQENPDPLVVEENVEELGIKGAGIEIVMPKTICFGEKLLTG